MATNYQGFLLQFPGGRLPRDFTIEYSSVPDRRQEDNGEVDQNGHLHRVTMPHKRTTVKFTIRMLNLEEKISLQSIMGYQVDPQRRVQVTFWNDETNDYSTDYFYLPDIEFSVRDCDQNTIYYNPIAVELIQY